LVKGAETATRLWERAARFRTSKHSLFRRAMRMAEKFFGEKTPGTAGAAAALPEVRKARDATAPRPRKERRDATVDDAGVVFMVTWVVWVFDWNERRT
jgi:hypothetical protein